MEKKTIVIGTVVGDVNEKLLSIGEKVLSDFSGNSHDWKPTLKTSLNLSGEVGVKPAIKHFTNISQLNLRVYRRKKGKKLDSKRVLVFIEKPKYSKRSRLSNFWPKMPRSKDLGDLLRYHLGRINHE